MSAPLAIFLTAYDPAELPGGTVDPLGFTGGYLALADALFPGMTAAAGQATYLPMLCAGLCIAEADGELVGLSAGAQRKQRIDVALRFERLWALASALQVESDADPDDEDAESKVAGLRGIRYVQREIQRLRHAGAKKAGTSFALLAQQYGYGAFGIYGVVAEELGLIDKSTLEPSPEVGRVIGQSFLETTADGRQRRDLVRAAREQREIALETLRDWGSRAHPGAPLRGRARDLLREALLQNRERARTVELIERAGRDRQGRWSDRTWMAACLKELPEAENPKLHAALEAALAYDDFLRSLTLIFERVLWCCHRQSDAAEVRTVFDDPVIGEASAAVPERANHLCGTVEQLAGRGQRNLRSRGRGIFELAQRLTVGGDVEATVCAVLERHAKIQAAKIERGRPKQAWIEQRDNRFALTSTRVGMRAGEPRTVDDIRAPDWRFGAASSFLRVVGGLGAREAA